MLVQLQVYSSYVTLRLVLFSSVFYVMGAYVETSLGINLIGLKFMRLLPPVDDLRTIVV